MDIEKLITQTFTAHEHVAPDGERVLTDARRRIDRGRVLSRPVAVAAGVAVLTLGAVTVVALNRPDAQETQAAGPAGEVTVAGPAPAVAALPMPYSLDWLPPGSVEYLARRINVGSTAKEPKAPLFGGEYLMNVTANGQVLMVDVQEFKMFPVDQAAFKSGPGQPVTINGQHGVESANSAGPAGYELYLTHGDGAMYVGVAAEPGSTAPAQQLIETGRRIAQNIRFPGATTVTPAFGLRDLPNGMRICAFEVGRADGPLRTDGSTGSQPTTRYSLGTCTTMPPVIVGTNSVDRPGGTPGEPVQGHATRHVDENGYRTLLVLDAVDAAPVTIAGAVPLTDLYDIANRLVLPN
ncbi:hypothetical protein [Actinophytocola sp.]|uniref:hypothetical protein n=1 Tax=Actinophytocola sp. TaxID=1872138 RepID=UPI002D7FB0A7|nr:hypothetical protein [Actinophytocola sp.]HET9138507.1 hypothetical protein [Actinophytocola sp.]